MNFLGLLKKRDELSTSNKDPFNLDVFPDEIRQLILSYLSVDDLINACLVSRLWNETIGSSLAFRKNVAIKLHSWNSGEPPISNSSRNYEILTICNYKFEQRTLAALRGKNWKNVTLSIGKIPSQKSFIKIMEIFKNVKNLKVLSTNIRELNTTSKLVLPELTTLALSDVTLDLFDIFITHQPSLKSLSLRFISCDILSPQRVGEALVHFLTLNENIKHLEINHTVTNDLFLVNIAKALKLKLKSLVIGFNSSNADNSNSTYLSIRSNIEEFLKSQGESIEYLKLVLHQKFIREDPDEAFVRRWRAVGLMIPLDPEISSNDVSIIFNQWNSLTSLKHLNIRFLQNSEDFEENRDLMKSLKRNTNVISLSLQFMNVQGPPSLAIALMKLLPNLQSLYITKLTPNIVRHAAINLKALRMLNCFSFEGECQQEYNDLKASQTAVNNFIVISDRCAYG